MLFSSTFFTPKTDRCSALRLTTAQLPTNLGPCLSNLGRAVIPPRRRWVLLMSTQIRNIHFWQEKFHITRIHFFILYLPAEQMHTTAISLIIGLYRIKTHFPILDTTCAQLIFTCFYLNFWPSFNIFSCFSLCYILSYLCFPANSPCDLYCFA